MTETHHDPTSPVETATVSLIRDFISGIEVQASPEEVEATQPFSRMLVEDYGYPVACIQTRPQFKVKARPSDTSFSYPVDIAVFSNEQKLRENLHLIVECKKAGTTPEEGQDRQLFNYLKMSAATLGVWTDGTVHQFFRKTSVGGELICESIPNLPRHGESVDEIGRYRRDQLRIPSNLTGTFKALRNHLAGNAIGTTRDEALAGQLINLVFCKIYDELHTRPEDLVTFRYQLGDSPADVGQRIRSLFAGVKSNYPDVFEAQDSITIDDAALAVVVGRLQPYEITKAPRDSVGEAFEVFVGGALKGGQGQFFTPRNVVRLMVELADPKPSDRVIDPACGAGGFLVEVLRHKWARLDNDAASFAWTEESLVKERMRSASTTIFGIEKDSFLAKVTKAYMALLGDGQGGIYCEDSLDRPATWGNLARQNVQLGTFDVVLANPPFGKDIKVVGEDKLAQFDLAHQFKPLDGVKVRTDSLQKKQNPQVLFIERCLQLAKSGGTVGIILPETYFHAPQPVHIRSFLTAHNVTALIDLPHNTFRPFNNAKCVAILVQKDTPQQESIRMIAAEQMGHDHRGERLYRYDESTHQVTGEIWDDLSAALDALKAGEPSEFVFEVAADSVKNDDIFIPRYYWPRFAVEQEDAEAGTEWITLRELKDSGAISVRSGHGSPSAQFKGRGTYPYVRVKDIINWEVYRDPTASIPHRVYASLTEGAPLHQRDILYVSRGSYRIGDVAMVGPDDCDAAVTREIHIIRSTGADFQGEPVDPFYLLYLLTTPVVALQTRAKVFLDTTLPNIANRYLDIELPWSSDSETRRVIAQRVQTAVEKRWGAIEDIRQLLAELRPLDAIEELLGEDDVQPDFDDD